MEEVDLLQKDVESLQNDKGAQAAIIRRMKKHDPRVINAVAKIHDRDRGFFWPM